MNGERDGWMDGPEVVGAFSVRLAQKLEFFQVSRAEVIDLTVLIAQYDTVCTGRMETEGEIWTKKQRQQ